jgi:hypothetical protein
MLRGNKITIKSVSLDNTSLSSVIYAALGKPSQTKVQEVINSYKNPNKAIIGVFVENSLLGILGFSKSSQVVTINHVSILAKYQKQGLGTLLVNKIKKDYQGFKIISETDEEAVDFYV